MDKFTIAQEDNASCRSELTANLEKYQDIQKQYESEQCTSEKNADLAQSLQEKFDNELKRVEDLNKKLDDEHAKLKQIQQSLDTAQQENAVIKVSTQSIKNSI